VEALGSPHVQTLQEVELVADHEVGQRDQIGRTDRLATEARDGSTVPLVPYFPAQRECRKCAAILGMNIFAIRGMMRAMVRSCH